MEMHGGHELLFLGGEGNKRQVPGSGTFNWRFSGVSLSHLAFECIKRRCTDQGTGAPSLTLSSKTNSIQHSALHNTQINMEHFIMTCLTTPSISRQSSHRPNSLTYHGSLGANAPPLYMRCSSFKANFPSSLFQVSSCIRSQFTNAPTMDCLDLGVCR